MAFSWTLFRGYRGSLREACRRCPDRCRDTITTAGDPAPVSIRHGCAGQRMATPCHSPDPPSCVRKTRLCRSARVLHVHATGCGSHAICTGFVPQDQGGNPSYFTARTLHHGLVQGAMAGGLGRADRRPRTEGIPWEVTFTSRHPNMETPCPTI